MESFDGKPQESYQPQSEGHRSHGHYCLYNLQYALENYAPTGHSQETLHTLGHVPTFMTDMSSECLIDLDNQLT